MPAALEGVGVSLDWSSWGPMVPVLGHLGVGVGRVFKVSSELTAFWKLTAYEPIAVLSPVEVG